MPPLLGVSVLLTPHHMQAGAPQPSSWLARKVRLLDKEPGLALVLGDADIAMVRVRADGVWDTCIRAQALLMDGFPGWEPRDAHPVMLGAPAPRAHLGPSLLPGVGSGSHGGGDKT